MGICGSTPYKGAEKNVVIVGGGYAAVYLCAHFQKSMHNLRITILSPGDYFDVAWASPRAIAEPAGANRNVIQFSKIFKNGRVKHKSGSAASVSKTAVTTNTGEVLPYDVLVIATGALYPAGSGDVTALKATPGIDTAAARVKQLRDLGAKVAGAKGVMVVGAGFSGLEVAGEIAYTYPNLPVKLFTGSKPLGHGMPASVQKGLVASFAKKTNVTVITGPRGSAADAEQHGCDVVFMCTGMVPTTSFLQGGDLAGALDAKGFVQTTPTLQVKGFSNVFSFGDCASPSQSPSMSGYHTINAAAGVVGPNIIRMLNGEALKPVKPAEEGGMITLNKSEGAGYMGTMVFPNFLVKMMKSGDLFRGKMSGELTGAPPSFVK